jgi:glycosyltransferase involved in cell wall biosynthesis
MLSVTIITLNEGRDLPRCLNSVKDIADEIILVDSGSSDKTVSIAKNFGAKVFERKFDNYANQKNYALEKTSGEWVLSLDGDEEISPELKSEIASLIKSAESRFNGYSIPRRNIIFGKYIKHSRWQPELDRHIWLWKKEKGKWVGAVHEEVEVNGRVGRLNGAKIHYQYQTVKEFMEMMNGYSELEAKQKVKNGVKYSHLKLIADPLYNFFVRYIYRLGILDGWRGFVLSYLMAIYHLEVWIKVWNKR